MNAVKHAELSVHRRGGHRDDYYPLHDFMDSTKELCSDNRHRILHTLWGIKRVIIPIFGHTLTNADGKRINVKDLCEQDHVLPDYRNRFIPTLADFAEAVEANPDDAHRLQTFFNAYQHDEPLRDLLLSPLSQTGRLKSLWFTHNSWFLNEIVPRVLNRPPRFQEFSLSPADFFRRMRFEPWMDNGHGVPPSAQQTLSLLHPSS
ncbi:hypothetical protein SAMN05421823_104104 [Catalinimonas alkaloidigena]|uniref:DUF6915 domain-containing protein n=1 Tax=Catalinimonas alkaloidigena TaxID=1075417 RepID=A0A1G9GH48_9BACT|nr:hypothetical protein [Catalinimonas alkaloidigena]SDK99967.1 hypothetical protein SAMN05421823_104104 [Catalinimonas alkaloidigena]